MADLATLAVFGATGQVGRALGALPVPEGWRLLALDRTATDITQLTSVDKALTGIRRGVVVNLAAFTQVDRAESESPLAFTVNRDGAENVARAAARQGLPVIYLSTDYVFPGTHSHPLTENTPTAPCNVYGSSKLAGEEAVLSATNLGLILRTSWVFGVHGANFVKSILRRALVQTELGVVSDQFGSPTPAPAIAAALWFLAQQLAESRNPDDFGIFHFSGAPATNWHGFAKEILSLATVLGHTAARAHPIATEDYPLPAKRPAYSILDCSKLTRQHGILQPSWRLHLKETLPAIIEAL